MPVKARDSGNHRTLQCSWGNRLTALHGDVVSGIYYWQLISISWRMKIVGCTKRQFLSRITRTRPLSLITREPDADDFYYQPHLRHRSTRLSLSLSLSVCLCVSVCLSVCLSVCVNISCEQNIYKSYPRMLMKFCGEVWRGPASNRLILMAIVIFQDFLPLADRA